MTPTPEPITLERQVGCARCGGDGHDNIMFQPLTYPVVVGLVELTHWAPCPTNGEPILMIVTDSQDLTS